MATRAVIGVYTNREQGLWRGVYHHWDGYPTGLGQALWQLYNEHFKNVLPAMVEVLIDSHPHGWSTIVSADWNLRPTWIDNTGEWYSAKKSLPPLSYKYRAGEQPWPFDQDTDGGQEWAYVIDQDAKTMTILRAIEPWDEAHYREVATVSLEGDEPDWKAFE